MAIVMAGKAHPAELLQTPFELVNLFDPLLGIRVSRLQSVFVGFEPRVELEDT
jgi:hypothetical protein